MSGMFYELVAPLQSLPNPCSCPSYVPRGLPCGTSAGSKTSDQIPLAAGLGNGLKRPLSLCAFYRSFMNNWEVYKLLAHVRPPVSKVLANCSPHLILSHPQFPFTKCFSQFLLPTALPTSLSHSHSVLSP